MLQYQELGQRVFAAARVPVLSVALDATRVDLRETLCCALYSPLLALGVWAPPQAGKGPLAPNPRVQNGRAKAHV
eukprot:7720129-Lingulodinium_polyedra.AAC.1